MRSWRDALMGHSIVSPILFSSEGAVSRGEIIVDSLYIDRWLTRRKVGSYAVIACDASLSRELVALIFAAAAVGATLFPIADGLPPAARAQLERAAGVTLTLTNSTLREILAEESLTPAPPPPLIVRRILSHAAFAVATSGSTGTPRVISIPWSAAHMSAINGASVIPFRIGDVWLASLSCAHIGGLMIVVRALVLGGAVRVATAPRLWRDLDGVTHASLVATQLARLMEDPASPPPSLRAVMLGGGPSSAALRDAAVARIGALYSTYGLTETSSQVATTKLQHGDPDTLVGAPLPDVKVVIDARNNEIVLDGPMLADAEFIDGRRVRLPRPLYTRDVGWIDDARRLHVTGRLDGMFISGGKNIHPEEIERALSAISSVRAVCVVAVADETWGARPVAFIAVADHAYMTKSQLNSAARAALAPHLIPDAYFLMPEDEAARAKPSRAALAARLAAGEQFTSL